MRKSSTYKEHSTVTLPRVRVRVRVTEVQKWTIPLKIHQACTRTSSSIYGMLSNQDLKHARPALKTIVRTAWVTHQ